MRETQPIAPLPGRPLGMRDILMECVNYEDRLIPHVEFKPSEATLKKPLPAFNLPPAARHTFGRQITKFVWSMMP